MFSNFRSTFFFKEHLPVTVSADTCLKVTPKKIKQNCKIIYTAQKMKFPFRISSVDATKSAGNLL